MVYQHADWKRVPEIAASDQSELYIPENKPVKFKFNEPILINHSGYIYIWLSNESKDTRVWFDDLTVTHSQNIVVQASDYGVWGDVLREQRSDERKYRFGYQGQFAEKDEETGWNHFELREYDAIIGRWLVPDPARVHWSPYLAMNNNPQNSVDPDGGCEDGNCPPKVGDINDAGQIYTNEGWTNTLQEISVSAPRMSINEFVDVYGFNPAPMDATKYVINLPNPELGEFKYGGVVFYSSGGGGQGIFERDGSTEDGFDLTGAEILALFSFDLQFFIDFVGLKPNNTGNDPKPPTTRDSTVHGPLIQSYRISGKNGVSRSEQKSFHYTIDNETNKIIKTDSTILFGK